MPLWSFGSIRLLKIIQEYHISNHNIIDQSAKAETY